MTAPFPLRAIAACFALACFVVAIAAGLGADRDAAVILKHALVALIGGQLVGLVAAYVMARAFADALGTYRTVAGGTTTDGGIAPAGAARAEVSPPSRESNP